MKIYHFSDTHNVHQQLNLPDLSTIDVIIFSGDESNYRNPVYNEQEFYDFIDWYAGIDHPHKIMIAGNHSAYIATNKKQAEAEIGLRGIIYLNKDHVDIKGKRFYGDPVTPTFGEWYYMANRAIIHKHYEQIPEDCNVLITHGPPKGILDLSHNRQNELEMCGCSSLRRAVANHKTIQLHCFGHIHDTRELDNHGVLYRDGKIYSNGACVVDGKFGQIYNHGNIIEIE